MAHYDSVVIGAGPAGAATALALARQGRSVAIVSKMKPTWPRIGETVPPGIVQLLVQLGVWEDFLAAGHEEAPGTAVLWGAERPFENDFIFNPYGRGWHLNRGRFDRMLVESAKAAGVVLFDVEARACVLEPSDGWRLSLDEGSSHTQITARWLVDATGRKSWLARRLGSKREQFDRLVALIRFSEAGTVHDQRTLIETCPQGWWYAATLPGQQAVAALFTDADLLPHGADARARLWDQLFERARIVPAVFKYPPSASHIHVAAAASGRTAPCAGDFWIAVGDAQQAYDPLSGQGISKALRSGLYCAEVISRNLRLGGSAVDDLHDRSNRDFAAYLQGYQQHYQREQRWSGAPFWSRRSASEFAPLTASRT